MTSRADVGADGKTGYERCKERHARLSRMEFWEAVLWKRQREGGPLGKLSCVWEDGIYLGVKETTDEKIVGERRQKKEERWGPKMLELVGGVPWRTDSRRETAMTSRSWTRITGRRSARERAVRWSRGGCTSRRVMLRNTVTRRGAHVPSRS